MASVTNPVDNYEERKVCLSQLLDSEGLSPAAVVSPTRTIDQFLMEMKRASKLSKKTSAPLLLFIFCHGLSNFHLLLNYGNMKKGLCIVKLKVCLSLVYESPSSLRHISLVSPKFQPHYYGSRRGIRRCSPVKQETRIYPMP